MKFSWIKTKEPIVYSSEPFYDLTNGYINPELMLTDSNQIDKINEAIYLVDRFIDEAFNKKILGEI